MSDTVRRYEGTTRVNIDGRITIPAFLRKPLGIAPGDEVDLILEENGRLVIRKSDGETETSPPN